MHTCISEARPSSHTRTCAHSSNASDHRITNHTARTRKAHGKRDIVETEGVRLTGRAFLASAPALSEAQLAAPIAQREHAPGRERGATRAFRVRPLWYGRIEPRRRRPLRSRRQTAVELERGHQ